MISLSSSSLLALAWFVGFASVASRLPDAELVALSVVSKTLGKSDWHISLEVDPCTNQPPWWINNSTGVYCNCTTQNTTTCHVTRLVLNGINLNGSLPQELVELPFLEEIDLTRNYLSGTIPQQWGSMKSIKIINLSGNRLEGRIPNELANISTLEQLVLEANKFNGSIPSELGNLANIEKLVLASNYLTGPIPQTLEKLTTLTEFRISDNNFTGRIPDFIKNWVNVKLIHIEGSGLTGPIPTNLTSLTKLNDLRISDLNGRVSKFPSLSSSQEWEKLILRSCNIEGVFPKDIARMKIDENLDLSFNKLTGQIPTNVGRAKMIYLTGNFLNGTVPIDMQNKDIDLSYNNFSVGSSPPHCGDGSPNLFANSRGNTSRTFYCISPSCKPNDYYSFKVNCGSTQKVGDYEADGRSESKFFFSSSSNWGFSRTGDFLYHDIPCKKNQKDGDDDEAGPNEFKFISSSSNPGFRRTGDILNNNTQYEYGSSFTWPPDSGLHSPSSLYTDARLSPLSLTYFGYCLRNGNYTVKLHFAEIMFPFGSLGRRFFDIYIQGKLVRKDFNIEDEAGGVNKPHILNFTAEVVDHTMEIRFYWAGKGTTALPQRSVYGPLISAISVVHNDYRPPKGISTGVIVGIVGAVVLGFILILGILWWKGCLCRKDSMHHDLRGLDFQTGSFTLRQIRAATNNFDPSNKIGEGGFGPVYKGVLLDGTVIAVKQLSSKSKQGNREFINEIGMISALQHPHLVKLYGCCIEDNHLLLVYEFCENNSLARALFGPEEYQLHLDWATRHNICIGIAKGLAYLHEESRLKIVHRDIKATNVLLDGDLNPKISDFGLAKLDEEENTHISTRIAGTFGYMSPEYAMRGYLTDKADVYSYGVVVLEIVSGRSNSSIRPKEANFYLLDWANSLKAKGNLLELVDPRLELKFDEEELSMAVSVALLCTNAEAAKRPSMSAVVRMLEGRVSVDNLDSVETTEPEEMEMRRRGGNSISVDVPWTGSSTSTPDLYPIDPDTSYWEKRGL